jgi:hypothetical protein
MRPLSVVFVPVIASAVLAWKGQVPEPAAMDPLAFVATEYIHGVPYTEARALGARAAPVLIKALGDPAFGQWRSNIVVTLGFLGDPGAVDPLMGFLEKTAGEVDDVTFDALLDVPTALGDIARLSGDPKGDLVLYLQQGAQPPLWQKRNIRWFTPPYEGERLHRELASRSIAGLGRVASGRSIEILTGLVDSLAEPALKRRAADALELSKRIRNEGPAAAFMPRQSGAAVRPPMDMAPATVIRHELAILRHVSVRKGMTDADADTRLSGATALLQRDDRECANEVGCAVTLARSAPVDRFGNDTDGLEVIDDNEDLEAVLAVRGDIKVVKSIKRCGGADGRYVGCSRMGQQNMIVIAGASEDTFAHEFGHTKGIDDRCMEGCTHWIMTSGATHRKAIDRDECTRFQTR